MSVGKSDKLNLKVPSSSTTILPLTLSVSFNHKRRYSLNPSALRRSIFEIKGTTPLLYFKKIAVVAKTIIMLQNQIKSQRSKGYWSRLETQTAIQQQLSEVLQWKLSDIPVLTPKTASGHHLQQLLAVPARKRTITDESMLLRYVQRLHTIQDFPLDVQKRLAKVMTFESYESGRIIIKETHPAISVYFIWYGTVYVNQKETDVRTDRVFDLTVNLLKPGDWFGERGVLYRTKHNVTVITRGYVELLVVHKKDFHEILAHSVLDKTQGAIQFLSELPLISAWPIHALSSSPDYIYAKYFKYNSVIVKCSPNERPEWIVAVKRGSCRIIIEFLEHVKDKESFRLPLVPPSVSLVSATYRKSSLNKKITVKRRFMQLNTVEQGECFGLQLIYNKPICRMSLISRGSECVLIKRHFFIKHTNPDILRLFRTESGYFPDKSQLIGAINEQNKWKLFKKHIIHELL